MKKFRLEYILITLSSLNFIGMLVSLFQIGNNVPIHFNEKMIVDRMGSPWFTIVLAIIPVLCSAGLLLEMKLRGEKYENKKILRILLIFIILFFIYIGWLVFAMTASGLQMGEKYHISLELLIGIPIGILFLILGNYSPVIKPNRTLGLRTISTLKSEVVWTKSHRLLGILGVCSGLITIICSIVSAFTSTWVFFSGIMFSVVLIAIIPMIYARVLYNKIKKKEASPPSVPQ